MEEEATIDHLIKRAMEDNLSLEIDYVNNDWDYSTRIISNIKRSLQFGPGYISAYCHLRNEDRTFKIGRISNARIVPSAGPIKPIFKYEFDRSKPIFRLYGGEY